MRIRFLALFLIIITLLPAAFGATLHGTVYNTDLEVEQDVLIEVDTQQYLAKDGTYSFELPAGKYTLIARKGLITTLEEITIEGDVLFDLFLLPDFSTEDELWQDANIELFIEEEQEEPPRLWAYLIAAAIFIFSLWRITKARKKYGKLSTFRKQKKIESAKTIEEHKEEISQEPTYLEKTLEIIQKNEGRISQKLLRKEMLHLSEAKVSLILTQLEHEGKIEKVKKGRGNVILLKRPTN